MGGPFVLAADGVVLRVTVWMTGFRMTRFQVTRFWMTGSPIFLAIVMANIMASFMISFITWKLHVLDKVDDLENYMTSAIVMAFDKITALAKYKAFARCLAKIMASVMAMAMAMIWP